jgi:hypothetical protein
MLSHTSHLQLCLSSVILSLDFETRILMYFILLLLPWTFHWWICATGFSEGHKWHFRMFLDIFQWRFWGWYSTETIFYSEQFLKLVRDDVWTQVILWPWEPVIVDTVYFVFGGDYAIRDIGICFDCFKDYISSWITKKIQRVF